jgi:hypothetical protein
MASAQQSKREHHIASPCLRSSAWPNQRKITARTWLDHGKDMAIL